jgi:hypothetical protein
MGSRKGPCIYQNKIKFVTITDSYRSKFVQKIAAPRWPLLPSHRYLISLMISLQLYGYAAGPHRAETLDSTFSLSVVSCSCSPVGLERLKGCI